jgi:hypothetical protein
MSVRHLLEYQVDWEVHQLYRPRPLLAVAEDFLGIFSGLLSPYTLLLRHFGYQP